MKINEGLSWSSGSANGQQGAESRAAFFLFFFFFFWSFCLYRAATKAYGGPQARGPIGAAAAG